jgi:hypothetical protein
MTRASRTGIAVGIAATFLSGILAAAAFFLHRARAPIEDYIRRNIIVALRQHFASDVELAALHISVFPRIHVVGEGLVLRGKNDAPDALPLISVRKFVLNGEPREVFKAVPRFRTLTLDGLEMHIPAHRGDRDTAHAKKSGKINFIIDDVSSSDAEIDLLRAKADKPTLVFAIHKLKISSFQPDEPAAFHATLRNPRPIGEIEVEGQLGPWDVREPSLSPLSGNYEYTHADLGTFPGISGFLSSRGEFSGVLDYIAVQGITEIPDFAVAAGGHPMRLNTEFDAIVDGTNGNTYLKSVNAHFLRSTILISGEIAKSSGQEDRAISLKVRSRSARVEDLLTIAVKSPNPLLTGDATLNTTVNLRLHQGQNVFDRLEVSGRFGITTAKFTADDVQDKINRLSQKSLGHPDAVGDADAVSDLNGDFTLKDGLMNFSSLQFAVAGAAVRLNGSYDVRGESVDFHGTLRMDAKLSQTTKGAKSLLLKFVDPFFAKSGAGAVLPIKIQGSRSNPLFGLELHRNNGKTSN